MRTKEAVLSFIEAINAHDVDRIVSLCSGHHQFVDAHGTVVLVDQLRAAWIGYFHFMPHYGIAVETILCDGDVAAVFGFAWGSLNAKDPGEQSWRRPCAWKARVENDLIKLWQIYVDTKAVFDLL